MTERTKTCRSHCRACSGCFAGDSAFEAHRYGSYEPSTRACWPDDSAALFTTSDGECRISAEAPLIGCAIYSLTRGLERVSKLRVKPLTPVEA